MQKIFSTVQVRQMTGLLLEAWEEHKKDIQLSSKALYGLIGLKKQLEQKLTIIEETLATLASQYDGQTQENGSIVIPPERRAEAHQAFLDLGNQEVYIDYSEIVLTEDSVIPVPIYEALFDFITFND